MFSFLKLEISAAAASAFLFRAPWHGYPPPGHRRGRKEGNQWSKSSPASGLPHLWSYIALHWNWMECLNTEVCKVDTSGQKELFGRIYMAACSSWGNTFVCGSSSVGGDFWQHWQRYLTPVQPGHSTTVQDWGRGIQIDFLYQWVHTHTHTIHPVSVQQSAPCFASAKNFRKVRNRFGASFPLLAHVYRGHTTAKGWQIL